MSAPSLLGVLAFSAEYSTGLIHGLAAAALVITRRDA